MPVRQIGGSVRIAQVEDQSRCVSRRIRSPTFPADSVCVFKWVPTCRKSAQIIQFCFLAMRQASA